MPLPSLTQRSASFLRTYAKPHRHATATMAFDLNPDSAQRLAATPRYAWSIFGVVFALMVADYVDRQVVVSMFPHLKAQWHLSDRQLGALVSVISVVVAIGTLPLSLPRPMAPSSWP